jgi:hypothetical protein
MAIVDSNPFGPMRGTMGGLTFSKTKGHQTVRSYIHNKKSLSIAQQNNRSNFNAYSKAFSTLGPAEISNWNLFAGDNYAPLGRTNSGQFSGYNAFMGCQMAYAHNMRFLTTPVITLGPTPVTLGFTNNPDPPINGSTGYSVMPFLRTIAPPNLPLHLDSCSFTSLHVLSARIRWGNTPGLHATMAGFSDPLLQNYGFAFYMSDPVGNSQLVPKHSYRQLICTSGTILVTTPNLIGSDYGDFVFPACNQLYNSKQLPSQGRWVKISAVVIGPNGTQALIGSLMVQIS